MQTKPIVPSARTLIIIMTVFCPINVLLIGLRLWARKLKQAPLATSDFLIIAAGVFIIAYTVLSCVISVGGVFGYPVTMATLEQDTLFAKLMTAQDIIWGLSTTFMKASALMLYLEIFQHKRALQVVVYLTLIFIFGYMVAIITLSFALCHPVQYNWDKAIPGGRCVHYKPIYEIIGVINIPLDFAVVCYPMPILWKLQMPTSKKLIVSGIISIGLMATVFSVLRLASTFNTSEIEFEINLTQSLVATCLYGGLETQVGIFSACLPLMQPVIVQVFGKDSKVRSWLSLRSGSKWNPSRSFSSKKQAQNPRRTGDSEHRRRLTHDEGTEMSSHAPSRDVDMEDGSGYLSGKGVSGSKENGVTTSS